MVSTTALAKKILSGLNNPAVDNEIWLRDVLDAAFADMQAEIDGLVEDVRELEREKDALASGVVR